jgi:hypothetical protein
VPSAINGGQNARSALSANASQVDAFSGQCRSIFGVTVAVRYTPAGRCGSRDLSDATAIFFRSPPPAGSGCSGQGGTGRGAAGCSAHGTGPIAWAGRGPLVLSGRRCGSGTPPCGRAPITHATAGRSRNTYNPKTRDRFAGQRATRDGAGRSPGPESRRPDGLALYRTWSNGALTRPAKAKTPHSPKPLRVERPFWGLRSSPKRIIKLPNDRSANGN